MKDEEFKSNLELSFMRLLDGKALFLRSWFFFESILNTPSFIRSPLPGFKKGISASTIAGYNIGISNYINDIDEKKAAILAFQFMTSLEIQKEYFKNGILIPGIFSIYKDKSLCPYLSCEIFEYLQLYGRPSNKTNNYEIYIEKFSDYIREFLYENKTAAEILLKIDDITSIYSINPRKSIIGIIFALLIFFISSLMLISFIFPFKENFSPFFKFISLEFWFLSVVGSIVILNVGFTYMGKISTAKCHISLILISYGYTLNYIPILHKLITNFQSSNNFVIWVSKHKYIFFSFFFVLDTIISLLSLLDQYNIKTLYINEGKNFQKCNISYKLDYFFTNSLMLIKIIEILIILLFIFIEWNLKVTKYDIKFIVSAIYVDILVFFINFAINYSNINNYISHFIIQMGIVFIMSISNYFFLYGYRLFFAFLNKKNVKSVLINNINKNFIEKDDDYSKSIHKTDYDSSSNSHEVDNDVTYQSYNKNENSTKSNFGEYSSIHGKSLLAKIIDYHYITESDELYEKNTVNGNFTDSAQNTK